MLPFYGVGVPPSHERDIALVAAFGPTGYKLFIIYDLQWTAMKKPSQIYCKAMKNLMRATIAAVGFMLGAAESALADNHGAFDGVTIFMHGDTKHARFNEDGSVSGVLADIMTCATKGVETPFRFQHAPLSRAAAIIETFDNAIWFPTGTDVSEDRKPRVIGPIASEGILWYHRADATVDPNSPEFRKSARVTAYQGSRFADQLKAEGYNFIPGSADHQRLVYMLVSGQVDALLAVDFRSVLPSQTRTILETRLRTTSAGEIPLGMEASASMVEKQPELLKALQANVLACNKR